MKPENSYTALSKFLSLVLRHKPQTIGIELDGQGWADVETLIHKMNEFGKKIDFEILKQVVYTDNKKRYSFDEGFKKIRASQGHSINIDLGYTPQIPPELLYHGTASKFVDSILKTGLQKQNRHHVHLSIDKNTAIRVGQRHGKPVVFEIHAKEMYTHGYLFFISDNGVWLTEGVPVKFLRIIKS